MRKDDLDICLIFSLNWTPTTSRLHAFVFITVCDISVGAQRLLLLLTERQLRLLAKARWYVDGTFYVVKQPFKQLWSIHAIICVDNMKQVPLVFALLSSRRHADYRAMH